MREYIEGENTLAENEWLLKRHNYGQGVTKGFMSKFTLKGVLPKPFHEWGTVSDFQAPRPIGWTYKDGYPVKSTLPIFIIEEIPREGWSIYDYRIGKSQEWATMLHPLGFTIEIYLTNLLELIPKITITKGVLEGKFYWNTKKLIIAS